MTTTDTATFTLSQEEVYYLLGQVHARGLLGVDSAPLAAFDAEQRRAVLDAAARALLARGMIVIGEDGQPLLDAAVRAAIHAAAFAPASLTAIARGPGEGLLDTYIVHHAEPLWVEHTQPAPGLHQLALSPAPPAVQARIEQMLNVGDQAAPPAATFSIDQAELERIKAAAEGQELALHAAVAAAGADDPSARLFAELLAGPRDSAIVQAINRRGAEEATHTITFLRNQHGFWMLEATDPTHLRCRPAGAGDVRSALADLADQL
jgi:hypothetical protein